MIRLFKKIVIINSVVVIGCRMNGWEMFMCCSVYCLVFVVKVCVCGELVEVSVYCDGLWVMVMVKGLCFDVMFNGCVYWIVTVKKRACECQVIIVVFVRVTKFVGLWWVMIMCIGLWLMDDDNRIVSAKGCCDVIVVWLGVDDGDERFICIVWGERSWSFLVISRCMVQIGLLWQSSLLGRCWM